MCRSILSVGGRFGYTDDGETANTQIALYDFGDAKMIFEVRGLPTPAQRGASVGNIFHCANGYMVLPNYNRAVAHDNDGREIRSWQGADDHYGNFVRAVRSRRRQDLHGDIEEGHLSSALCHLANISYRLGEMRPFGQRAEAFGDDRVANETLAAMTDHLRTNSVDVANTMLRVGRRLTIDPRTEQFLDNAEANRHLTREYRQNFVVPARV